MEKNKKNVSYIVTEECESKHSDKTYSVIGNFKDKKKAQKFIKECADSIKKDWADYIDDDWEEEKGDDSYSLYRDDYVYFYELEIWEKELQ